VSRTNLEELSHLNAAIRGTMKPTHTAWFGIEKMEETLTLALNLMGTFTFGLSGGILGVKKRMDLFGVLVLSVATGLGGGIVRDLILGHTPPATLTDWRYLGTAGLASVLVFVWYNRIANHGTFITTFDAVGLSIFTVTGTVIALKAGLGPTPAALLGMLTGVGGGVLRDIMVAEVPLIFRSEIYAVASLLGAIVIITASQVGFSGIPAEILAAIATFTLRVVSLRRGWRIPIAMPKSAEKG
jgi:uncharacterized membrane protein YeiH